jgi:hypothetical protein
MKRARFIGGVLLVVAAAIMFLARVEVAISVPIALAVVGIALIATARRGR